MTTPYHVRPITAASDTQINGLADVLTDCVEGGASVSFMLPLSKDKALAFWRKVAADTERGGRALIIAEDGSGIIGTVQVILEQPENQPHRADISKMLVHRRARRLGVGEALMRAAEDTARQAGKTVLVLDTASPEADRLYTRLGWQLAGTIPDYALLPGGFAIPAITTASCDAAVPLRSPRLQPGQIGAKPVPLPMSTGRSMSSSRAHRVATGSRNISSPAFPTQVRRTSKICC
jgi:GNAT superfamily N-acetyltransferase